MVVPTLGNKLIHFAGARGMRPEDNKTLSRVLAVLVRCLVSASPKRAIAIVAQAAKAAQGLAGGVVGGRRWSVVDWNVKSACTGTT
jgi:hypothetical protein